MRQPTLSVALAGIMALAWAAALLAGPAIDILAAKAGMIPARLTGAAAGIWLVPAWLTPLTANLVHSGVLHLAFNALILIYCGQRVEPAIGGRWLALLLVAASYGAALGELAWAPGSTAPVIGASGATSGLLAMYAMLFSEQRVAARGPVPAHVVRALWLLVAWTGLQVLIGLASGWQVAVAGHVGGFATGLLLARPILNRRFARRQF